MSRLIPKKLHVKFILPTSENGPITPRFYTLTHSDRTGDLFLTIGSEYNTKQVKGLYTRLMRDEVLAEWVETEEGPTLHVHCQVGRGLGSAKFREAIFRRELPLVLESFRFGDRTLFLKYPHLDEAQIWIHFHTRNVNNDQSECWGKIREYAHQH